MKSIGKYENLLLYIVPALFVVGLGLLVYRHYHHNTIMMPSTTTSTSQSTATSTQPNPTPDVPGATQGTSNTTADVGLMAPSGDFVSNHSPTISNQYGRGVESSVCRTTIGAMCRIEFSKNGVTKTLQDMQVSAAKDSQAGSVIWDNWTPSSLGLDAGQWKITAVATLSGQTKTATDPGGLNVQP